MFLLFAAEAPAATPLDPSWFSPDTVANFIKQVGLGTFLVVFTALTTTVLIWYALRITLGENGFLRKAITEIAALVVKTLNETNAAIADIRANSAAAKISEEKDQKNSDMLREAGVEFAILANRIGEKVGADVKDSVERIHRILNKS